MNESNTEKRIKTLESKIKDLTKTVDNLNQLNPDSFKIKPPKQEQDRRYITDSVSEDFIDIMWDKVFYTSNIEPFAAAFSTSASSSSSTVDGIQETSGGVVLNTTRATRFRTSFYFSTVTAGSVLYITTLVARPASAGSTTLSTGGSLTGFKIMDGRFYGVNWLKGNESTKDLGVDVTQLKTHVVEVRYFPDERVDFYVDNVYRGSLAENITDIQNPEVFDLIRVYMYNTTAVAHTVSVEYYEFAQQRN